MRPLELRSLPVYLNRIWRMQNRIDSRFPGQVLVGSLERSRSHEIKALYILGANDGVFRLQ